jgi:two-component system chemotaxis response regulator CheY
MSAKISPSGLGPLCVLIVEDNEHMRILLRTVLRAFGIKQIWECGDGSAALKRIANQKPDLVLADFSMAPMDGIEFVKAVRNLPHKGDCVLPIIMVTGHTERRRVEAARDAGVNGIIAKPVTPAGLFQRIEEIIMRPRSFVRSPHYCGPCRRRHDKPDYVGPWRRETDTKEELDTVDIDTAAAAAAAAH